MPSSQAAKEAIVGPQKGWTGSMEVKNRGFSKGGGAGWKDCTHIPVTWVPGGHKADH